MEIKILRLIANGMFLLIFGNTLLFGLYKLTSYHIIILYDITLAVILCLFILFNSIYIYSNIENKPVF